jgi:hypothetical protein
MNFLTRLVAIAFATLSLSPSVPRAQNAAGPSAPNSDPIYQQLRNITLDSESVNVTGLDLKRDAATFHLHSGIVCFVPAVARKSDRSGLYR